ncbi:MAG: Nif11-like leader peptide family natural product precursor [Eggerthellaceae bacterium]|nr:Nif11-like leader peptide family natural product precursor [Eggerthellaceae bacterium]
MNFNDLTEEQKAKARACKTPEEMLALAREEGYELPDEDLEAVSGGWCAMVCNDDTGRVPFGR